MPISSVLTILDKPKHPPTALKRALALKELTECQLDLVAFCWEPMSDGGDVLSTAQRASIKKKILADRREWQLAQLQARRQSTQHINLKSVWTDDIAGWVVKQTANKPYDLVVKSIHATKSLTHTPLDWQLLRTCRVPMLFASKRQQRKSGVKVLATLDLRHQDAKHRSLNKRVLAYASEMASVRKAELHCVTAIEISQVLRDLDAVNTTSLKNKMVARYQPELEALIAPYGIAKSRVHFPVGKVGQVVAHQARALKADLLVVGTLAHKAKQSLGLGNSAEKIISRCPVDLMAIPPA